MLDDLKNILSGSRRTPQDAPESSYITQGEADQSAKAAYGEKMSNIDGIKQMIGYWQSQGIPLSEIVQKLDPDSAKMLAEHIRMERGDGPPNLFQK